MNAGTTYRTGAGNTPLMAIGDIRCGGCGAMHAVGASCDPKFWTRPTSAGNLNPARPPPETGGPTLATTSLAPEVRAFLDGQTLICPDCKRPHGCARTCAEYYAATPATKPFVAAAVPTPAAVTGRPKGGGPRKVEPSMDYLTKVALDEEAAKKLAIQKEKEFEEQVASARKKVKEQSVRWAAEYVNFADVTAEKIVRAKCAVNVDEARMRVEAVMEVALRPIEATEHLELGPKRAWGMMKYVAVNGKAMVKDAFVRGQELTAILNSETEVAAVRLSPLGREEPGEINLDLDNDLSTARTIEELDGIMLKHQSDKDAKRTFLMRRMELTLDSRNPYVPLTVWALLRYAHEPELPIVRTRRDVCQYIAHAIILHMGKKPIALVEEDIEVDINLCANLLGSTISTNHDLGTALSRIESNSQALKYALPHAGSTLTGELELNSKRAAIVFAAANCTNRTAEAMRWLSNLQAGHPCSSAFQCLLTDLSDGKKLMTSALPSSRRP
jgi:hypothetical protein